MMKRINLNASISKGILKVFVVSCFVIPLSLIYRLIPRREKLWLFGAFEGKRYSDNARYLYEWISKNKQNDIDAFWISKNKEIVKMLCKQGCRAEYAYSLTGIWLCFRAEFYFFCHTSSDINHWTSAGTKKVNLWHGTPLKKIGRDISLRSHRDYKVFNASFLRKLYYRMIFPGFFEQPFLFLSPSDYISQRFKSAFNLNNSHVESLGCPVNDRLLTPSPLFGEDISIQLINQFYKSGKKIIAYLPTYREETITQPNYDWNGLQHILAKHDALFVIKLHPFEEANWNLKMAPNIIVLDKKIDIYPLMSIASALVTDYSSIAVDYLLLNRPIIYFAYDLDEYLSIDRGMYEGYHEMTGGHIINTFEELLKLLESDVFGDQCKMQRKREKLCAKYHKHFDGKSCERIYLYCKTQKEPVSKIRSTRE